MVAELPRRRSTGSMRRGTYQAAERANKMYESGFRRRLCLPSKAHDMLRVDAPKRQTNVSVYIAHFRDRVTQHESGTTAGCDCVQAWTKRKEVKSSGTECVYAKQPAYLCAASAMRRVTGICGPLRRGHLHFLIEPIPESWLDNNENLLLPV